MAFITLAGTLRDPTSELAVGDQIRFTHKSTTGETVEGAVSVLTIDPSGTYSKDLQYGLVLVEYKDVRTSQFKNLGVATVNDSNPATSIPELLNALVPVSSAELIEFQTILADTVTARNEAEAFAASIDLINDLSQTYYCTKAEYEALTFTFPAGKTVHLNDRGADFKVISGTVTANTFNIIASNIVNQSANLKIKDNAIAEHFGAKGDWDDGSQTGTDDTSSLFAAKQYAKDNNVGVELGFGKKYRYTATYQLEGGEFLFGNGAYLVKDFAGIGIVESGGPIFNHLYDFDVYPSNAHKATQYEPASTEHGISINSNRTKTYNVKSIGHKGWGVYLNIDVANGNKSVWDEIESNNNGQGGVGVFGSQDDNSVGRAIIKTQGNYGYGFYCDAVSTLRQWSIWLYSENNWVGYTGATVYGVEIKKATACTMWIYSEEQGVNASEIKLGAGAIDNQIISARANLDRDDSIGNTNLWTRGNTIGGASGDLGGSSSVRNIVTQKELGVNVRSTSPTDTIKREFYGNGGFLFGSIRAIGGTTPTAPRLGFSSPDGSSESSVSDFGTYELIGLGSPKILKSSMFFDSGNHQFLGAKYTRGCSTKIKSISQDFDIVDTLNSTASGLATITSISSTDQSALSIISFEFIDGVLTQSTDKELGAFATQQSILLMVGNVLTLRFTESLGATVRFAGVVEMQAISY